MSMEITINLVATELVEALNNLAAAFGNKSLATPATTRDKKAGAAPKAETVTEVKPAPEETIDPLITEKPPKEEVTYTLVQVREKLAALSEDGKQAQVKTLITKLGAAKLSEIPEAKYAELMKEAGAL